MGYGWRQKQEAKLKIVEGDLSGSNQLDLDPTIHYITYVDPTNKILIQPFI